MVACASDLTRYAEDASGYRGYADQVFLPSTTAEVQAIARESSSKGIPLTVAGAGTGLTGARVPHGGWVVSLEKLRNIEIHSGFARCGAGALLQDLQKSAAKTRQFFGPNPTESSASIGGIISTNAGGARSFRYGSVRYHVLALEAVFMNGEVRRFEPGDRVEFPVKPIRVPATTKNSAGYFLQQEPTWTGLLPGSEGTLAIITEADLQLFPEPASILSGIVFFPTDELALRAVDHWRGVPELRLLEFIDEPALDLLRAHYAEIPVAAHAALLIEQNLASENDPEIEAWTDRLTAEDALEEDSWFGFTPADRDRFREFRHTLPVMVLEKVRRNGFPKSGTDFAVPVARNQELNRFYKKRCEEVFSGQYTIYGHAGDANNHVNLFPASSEEAQKAEELIYEFARFVVLLGGTIAAEHGVGKSKADLLELMFSEEEIQAMRDVKRHLDPQWLLGKGTIFAA